jgi:hypothetical protein
MPLGADLGGGLALEEVVVVGGGGSIIISLFCASGAGPLLRSISARRMFMAIIRHVKFSMRSALGSCVFAREYNFQICVPSGSFFCSCSGDSTLGVPASLPNAGNMASWSMPLLDVSWGDCTSMVPAGLAKSMGFQSEWCPLWWAAVIVSVPLKGRR